MIDSLLSEVHNVILSDIGGGLEQATLSSYTEKFDVTSERFSGIRLPKWPVGAVTSVKTGTNRGGAGSSVDADDYYVTSEGTLRLQAGAAYWPTGAQNVEVTWTAGFATTTSKEYLSLAFAEKLTVCEMFNNVGSAGKKSERIGSYSYSKEGSSDRGAGVYPAIAERIISRYRDVFPSDNIVP